MHILKHIQYMLSKYQSNFDGDLYIMKKGKRHKIILLEDSTFRIIKGRYYKDLKTCDDVVQFIYYEA